uniref:U5-Liphistoxin-Lth1a_1 n=1 Tax=Liphistius thaleban TaxID=1905330 RepID=A0A4Q8K4Y4_9ARAC
MATSKRGTLFILFALICISLSVVEIALGLPQAAPCRGRKCACFERIGLQCPPSVSGDCTVNAEQKCSKDDDCPCPMVCCSGGPNCKPFCSHGIGYPPPRD